MKSRILLTLGMAVLLPVFAVAPALAVDQMSTTPAQTDDSTTQTTTQTETEKAELQARLAKRKAALKTKLTTVEQKRLESRCKGAQGQVKSLKAKISGTETSRTQVYGNLVDRLTKLQEKLDQKGADTAELKTEIATLQTKIDTFKTDLATYKQSVSDLIVMDCATDPTGFKASLEEARANLKKVREDGLAIKSYVNDTIKPTLVKIRASLNTNKES